jgi:hypothetical protein
MHSKALSDAINKYELYMAKKDELENILARDQSWETIRSLKGFLPFISLFEMQVALASKDNTEAAEWVLRVFSIAAKKAAEIDPAILGYVGQAIDKILNNEISNPKIALGLSPKKGRKRDSKRTSNRNFNLCSDIVDAMRQGSNYEKAIAKAAEGSRVSETTAKNAYRDYKHIFPPVSRKSSKK